MQDGTIPSNRHVSYLAVTWLLMIPLVYFASRGQFWFQHSSDNELMADMLGAGSKINGTNQIVTVIFVMATVFLILFPRIPQLVNACYKCKIFVALSVLAVASSGWSQFPIKSLENSAFLVINTLFALYLWLRFSPAQRLNLFYFLGWICLIFSFVLSVYFPVYGLDPALETNAWRGLYVYKNACAMTTIFLLSVAFYLPVKAPLQKILRITYILLSILLVVMTQSRTGWILLACLLAYVAGMKIIEKVNCADRFVMTLLGIAIVLPITVAIISYSSQFFYFLGKDPTLTGRTDIWKAVVSSIMKRPILGYGYMAFFRGFQGENMNVASQVGLNVSASHNGFLDVWSNLGAVGLGLLLCSFVKAYKDFFVCLLSSKRTYWIWCGCIVVLTIVINIDEKAMMVPNDLIWILYILACVGLADGARQTRTEQADNIRERGERDSINLCGIHCAE